ncbi:RCC1 domain-containing protein [Sorangium sp. So ce854]|uniref:RCC1 domain-containing protein n=1 Tax=Sorangium sp. So ce854 TaxID=3133322 RepID=UPI003F6472A6
MACSSSDGEEDTGGAEASGGGDPGVASSGSGAGGGATSGAGAGSATSASGAGGGSTSGAGAGSATSTSGAGGGSTSSTGASSTTGAGGGDPGAASPACAGLNNGSGTTIPCAATADGKAVCFGSTTPTTLAYEGGGEVTGVVQATGRNFSEEACVLLDMGAVHCGRHASISRTPTVAAGATMVSGGLNHACAIVGNAVKCWGGDLPADVTFGGETPVQVACYYHGCCAVTDAGKLSCWGENNGGMHGIGTSSGTSGPVSPKTVPGRALYVGPGQDHMCAVFEGGKVQCWGQDWNKQLGGLGASSDPGVTLVESGAVAVVGGQFHTCVLMATGQVQCSSGGQSEGAGLDMGRLAPVAGISTAVALSAGKHYSCARLADASVQCWGAISHGPTPATINGLRTRGCD